MKNPNKVKAGKISWEKRKKNTPHLTLKKQMSEKGRKGFLKLAERLGGEDEAKKYTAALGIASMYRKTRPLFAQGKVEKYFDIFPNLKEKFQVLE